VASETTAQARNLLHQTRTELQDQASTQQQRIAGGIRSLSTELASMADRSEQAGPAADLARQAAQKTDQIAAWLDERDPGSLLNEVTSFARRRPGAFLAIAAGAGLLAGRLTRGAIDAARDDSSSTSGSADNFTAPTRSDYPSMVQPTDPPSSLPVPAGPTVSEPIESVTVRETPYDTPVYEPAVYGRDGRIQP